MQIFFENHDDVEEFLKDLQSTVCPHCGACGAFARHGLIRGYAGWLWCVKGWRVYCDPDSSRKKGCGRTQTLRLSGTLPGMNLTAVILMRFILALLAGSSVWKAWQDAKTGMSLRTGYRIFKRLENRQSVIRTALFGLSPPEFQGKEKTPLLETLKNLKEALGAHAVSAYQKTLQSAFL